MTALAKPSLGQAVTDPQFGTTIRRITAVPVSGSNPVIKPMYSTISAWNADESKMILYKVGSGHQLYDGKTYVYIKDLDINPADIEQVYWHTSDPDVFFYVDNKTLIRYHVSTGAKDQVRTFDFCSGGVSGGGDPMFMSWDSNRIGLSCGSTIFLYDLSTNTVVGQKTGPDTPQVSPSGTLAFVGQDVTDATLNSQRTLDIADPGSHASLGRFSSGNDTYNAVTFDPGPKGTDVGTLVTYDMTTGAGKVVVGPATGYPYPPSGTHVSALAYKQPGWIFLSVVGNPGGQGVLDNELVIADTNTGKVCRAAHHRSYGKNNTKLGDSYWAEPHVVPSPSGTRALFGSDWGNGPSVDSYVLELPGYKTSTTGADLRVSLADSSDPVLLGQDLTYTITTTNNGPQAAASATVSQTLPGSFTFVSASVGCTFSGTVTCALGSLAASASKSVIVVATPTAAGSFTSQASVTGSPADPDATNNQATLTTTVTSGAPVISVNDVSLNEGNSGTTNAVFTLTLSPASANAVTVNYATADGTATAGSDYTAVSGVVTFAAGQTSRTVSVPVLGDTVPEPDETFYLALTNPVGATLSRPQAKATILNDDAAATTAEQPVAWTATVGVSVSANSLTKTAATGWNDSGAVSTLSLTSGDGYVKFTASERSTARVLGLSNGNTNTDRSDIDFGFYLRSDGTMAVYERGNYVANFGSYATGDVMKVALVAGRVQYSRNGAVFYTSKAAPTLPLLVDTALYDKGATLKAVTVAGSWSPSP